MGIDALTRDLAGARVVPSDAEEWDAWVSASATRNHVLDNPLLDWLERHGEAKGYERDGEDTIDPRTDFLTFIFAQGAAFEEAVVRHLGTLVEVHVPEGAERGYEARRDLAVAEATFEAMRRGEPVIFQGVLRDAESRIYGAPETGSGRKQRLRWVRSSEAPMASDWTEEKRQASQAYADALNAHVQAQEAIGALLDAVGSGPFEFTEELLARYGAVTAKEHATREQYRAAEHEYRKAFGLAR